MSGEHMYVPAAKPAGSNSGTGSREPGRPYANLDSSGTQPLRESIEPDDSALTRTCDAEAG